MGARRIEYMLLEELRPAKRNPKAHDLGQIGSSIGRFGYVEPLVLDERTGLLVAGHGRLETVSKMRGAGEQPPAGVEVDSKGWRVPVVRGWASRSDLDAEAYILASNQLTTLGGWDNAALTESLKELAAAGALDGTGFDGDDLDELLKAAIGGQADKDDVPQPSTEPWVKKGDMFELGEHRLLCGDSTNAADLDRLMMGSQAEICWTDPPWNVAYGENKNPAGWSKRERTIANDNLGEDFPGFVALFCAEIKRLTKPGAPLYLAMSAQEWPTIDRALRALGFHWSSTIIWAKDSLVLSRKDYHTQYEPIWYGWNGEAARLKPVEDRTQSDVWNIDRPKKSEEHPTMKPVALVERALLRLGPHRLRKHPPPMPRDGAGAEVRPGGHRALGEADGQEGGEG